MKKIIILTILINIIFLSGCSDARELTDLELITAIGLEKAKDGYKVSIQLLNNSELGGEKTRGSTVVSVYSIEAKTTFEGLRKITNQSSRKLYASSMDILVIDEQLAKDGIMDILDFFMRDNEFNNNVLIILSRDVKAEEILSIKTPMERNPMVKIRNSVVNNQNVYGSLVLYSLEDLLKILLEPGVSPVISAFTIEGDKEAMSERKNIETIKTKAILTGRNVGVFADDKLVGYLSETETIGYNFIKNRIKSTVLSVEYNGKRIVLEVMNSKAKIKIKKNENQIDAEVKIDIKGGISEVLAEIDFDDKNEIKKLISLFEEEITRIVNSTITVSQTKYKSDILGIGNLVYKKYPKYYQQFENNWNDEYPKVDIKTNISIDIVSIGKTNNSLMKGNK